MTHIATVQLQDYYQHKVFESLVSKRHWSRFESRLRHDVDETLSLLDRYEVSATFFTLGWIAEHFSDMVRTISDAGHEIASAGYWGVDRLSATQMEFREDLRQGKEALESATGKQVIGYRSIRRSLTERELWHLDLIAEEGYLYDSSLMPAALPWRRGSASAGYFEHETRRGSIVELPHSTACFAGFRIPVGGGNFLRQLPSRFTFRAFQDWGKKRNDPFVLYFHPWELDTEQPQVSAFDTITRIRQYRNLGKMRDLLPRYFETARFGTAASFLGLQCRHAEPAAVTTSPQPPMELSADDEEARDITVVIPCHNESRTLGFLERALDELTQAARGRYRMRYILVDDKSTDNTLELLRSTFDDPDQYTVIPLPENRGVSGAIMAGIEAAQTDTVCSIDADCSYDPLELLEMIPLLTDGVSLITASPYHPDGSVLGVPEWRLFLSKGLSAIYRVVLTHKLATYTACFRVYHREEALAVSPEFGDFRGILELLVKLDMAGRGIVEYPTTLQSRLFGFSKMKTLNVIGKHLDMLRRMPQFRREVDQHSRGEAPQRV
jgi:polysaccharide deacetylase family protein (PEP-CTERM system associated)